jgi:hypothetical protein
MIRVTQKVGRLVEIRMSAPFVLDDLTKMLRDMGTITAPRFVAIADVSEATLFPDAVVDRLARVFRHDNQRLERAAFVVGNAATLHLQVERLLREGGVQSSPGSRSEPMSARDPSSKTSAEDGGTADQDGARGSQTVRVRRLPTRRAFRTAFDAMTWLDEVLTPEERARLRLFLDAPRAAM